MGCDAAPTPARATEISNFILTVVTDETLMSEVFGQTGSALRVLETDGVDMQKRDHGYYFSAEYAAKGSGIALNLVRFSELGLPIVKTTLDQYRNLVRAGKGELDKSVWPN